MVNLPTAIAVERLSAAASSSEAGAQAQSQEVVG
jgi:hypothetical protein